jgi:uncharacterized protein
MSSLDEVRRKLQGAIKSRDKVLVTVLRQIISEGEYLQIEKGDQLNEADVLSVVKSLVRQHKESIEEYSKGNRQDLVDIEQKELTVLEEYLPEQMSEDAIRQLVNDVKEEIQASSMKDMGRMMQAIMLKADGKADGKMVNSIVKEVLS